jgi:putative hydrolase of HD superfamily
MELDTTLFTLQKIALELSNIQRNHTKPQSNQHENNVEHSFTVALLCWYIASTCKLRLSIEKILLYALTHDIVEIYAGDTNTFASTEERAAKVTKEREALDQLKKEIPNFADLTNTIEMYEQRSDEESKFVWTVDKMQALILADMDDWRPYKTLSISYEDFAKKHGEQLAKSSLYTQEIFNNLIEYCKTTYYDSRENSNQ